MYLAIGTSVSSLHRERLYRLSNRDNHGLSPLLLENLSFAFKYVVKVIFF